MLDGPALIELLAIIHGEVSCEAAKQLGLDRLPCVRIGHLSPEEQRVLRLAVNRLAEKGEWDLDAVKIEFDELIVTDAPIEITGFSPAEIDHVILGDATEGLEEGPLEPDSATAVARVGDIFQLAAHRIVCGDATDPSVLARLLEGDASSRLILTDEPYNVKVAGNVTRGHHREFAMASGEMTDAEFLAFNGAWIATVLPYLCDGGILGTFIDWRGLPTVHSAVESLGLAPLNLIVWAKTNAGMGSLYRSQHELLPLFTKGSRPHVNNVELGIVMQRRACGPTGGPIAKRMQKISYAGYQFPPEIIQQSIWLYLRFTLSLRDVEDLLAERGVAVSYETVRRWVNHFGPMIAADLRKRRLKPHTTWHLDEVYLKIGGRMVYLWRAVDAEGEVLDVLVQSKRNKHAALKLMRKLLKKYAFVPERLVTDDL